MEIDWSNFTPVQALAGGALIGTGAALLLLVNGRIAGISGILSRVHDRSLWRAAFVAGLLLPALALTLSGQADGFSPVLKTEHSADWLRLALAGLLVGLGTRLANGCTSGHGICGLARLSPRSLVAVTVFMLTAMAVVAVAP